MILNIDLDGVLFPFHEEFSNFAGRDSSQITDWDIASCWGISKKEFYELFDSFILSGGFSKGEPEVNSVAVLKRLSKHHTISISTSRSTKLSTELALKTRQDTVQWLADHKIPHQNLFFLREKHLIGGLLLDDCPEYLEDYRTVGTAVCFNRPWNQNYNGFRVSNWLEFEESL